jgi:hypothetical protein
LRGGEADEAVGAVPAISSSVMASWGDSSAIVGCMGVVLLKSLVSIVDCVSWKSQKEMC